MKKPTKEEPQPPYWKLHIPKCPEHKEWKRDEHGFPIFHDDGVCTLCHKKDVKPRTPWYAFKLQILGYCEDCVKATMAPEPTPEEHAKYQASHDGTDKKATFKFPQYLWPDKTLMHEMEKIVDSL